MKAALTSEEEKRKEVEVKIVEERKRTVEAEKRAISSFKSLEKLKNMKVAFAQEAFGKGFDIC